VLISVLALSFVSSQPADLLALALTLAAATSFSLLPTVVIGVAAARFLRMKSFVGLTRLLGNVL